MFAQKDIKTFPSQINSNTTLEPGNYLLTGKCYVKKGAILILRQGITVQFAKDAEIIVEGSIDIEGKKNNLVNFLSNDPDYPGAGIVVRGDENSTINIIYGRFKYLSKPIHFEKNWLRDGINIKNNVFKFSEIYGACIEINDIDNVLADRMVNINIINNTFSNNSGSLLISNISSENISTIFTGNVITRNEYVGRDRNGMFTSPVFFTYNASANPQTPIFYKNSVFDNYSNLFFEDTLAVDYTNICVVGSADRLNVSNNYFGNPKNKEIEKTFDFVSANFRAPTLYFNKTDEKPDAELNGHFYKVLLDGEELNELLFFEKLKSGISTIDLVFNRPIINSEKYSVKYFYIKNDTLFGQPIKHKLKWGEGNRQVQIELNDNIMSKEKNGYLYVDGFYDENGIDVPALFIGKKQFLKNNDMDLIITNFLKKLARKDLVIKQNKLAPTQNDSPENPSEEKIKELYLYYSKFDSTVDNTDTILKVLKTSHFWEAGVFFGNALYWGDLVSTTIGLSLSNARPAVGIRSRYHFTDFWQLNLMANYMIIAGTDDRQTVLGKQRGTGYERGLTFRTYIFDIGATMELDLMRYRSIKSYVPTIFAGVNYYNFTPTAQVDGKWYKLRPVGTEGQTLKGGSGPYQSWAVGIPVGVSIKRHFGQKNIVAFSYTYNKLFTDYLDDVSTGKYPDPTELKERNKGLGETAVKLSNPNNQTGNRSASDDFDGYGYFGLTWTHKFYL
ncbi:MAG: hypothetical protein ACKVQB_00195 [Bacteroidia bacterium]